MKRSEAIKLRKIIEEAVDFLEDFDALEAPCLFPSWKAGIEYAEGDRVRHEGLLYKCITAHSSQTDWSPDMATSLFIRVSNPDIEYPEWVQPSGSHDSYTLGYKVTHGGRKWVSTIDANVYEPGVYGWTALEGGDD